MKQLSGLDELFLALERPNQCMHVAVLGVYDPGTAPGGRVRLRDIMTHMSQRLDVSPVFRRRLVRVPFDLDRAYWVDEPKVDLEYHVRHIALPKPGDWRQLCIQVARLHSQALDRAKPMWQAYVIEGLDNVEGVPPGSFAVYIKFHHAAVDGEASGQILRALHSLIAMPEHHAPSKPMVVDAPPTAIELYTRTFGNIVPRTARLWHAMTTASLKVTSLATESLYKRLASGSAWKDDFLNALGWPRTNLPSRFGEAVSSRRIVEGVSFEMAGVHQIRKWVGGATINDVFLTIAGGAVRRYLKVCGDAVDESFAAAVPAGQRDTLPGGDLGNRINYSRVPLHPHIEDPLQRLAAIRHEAAQHRQAADVIGRDLVKLLADELPTKASMAIAQRLLPGYLNTVMSTVRGPDVPLYFAGAQLKRYYPMNVVMDGLGLNISGFSYCDHLSATVVSCRKMMPDPEVFATCLRDSFEELLSVVKAEESAQLTMLEQRPTRRTSDKTANTVVSSHARRPRKRTTTTLPVRLHAGKTSADSTVVSEVVSKSSVAEALAEDRPYIVVANKRGGIQ
jgi:WS/DGAT/MGAT family acyltransferase